ncbi:MAG: hypothetical protein ACHQUB_03745, partial [Candidatus Saccharimonadia bacterium]
SLPRHIGRWLDQIRQFKEVLLKQTKGVGMIFIQSYIICEHCGWRNRLHKSPRKNMKLILQGAKFVCHARHCDVVIDTSELAPIRTTKMIRELRRELAAEGITPVC